VQAQLGVSAAWCKHSLVQAQLGASSAWCKLSLVQAQLSKGKYRFLLYRLKLADWDCASKIPIGSKFFQ
jgi:hypothetical protein